MKKFTSLIALMLTLSTSTALAQTLVLDTESQLITDASQLSCPVTTVDGQTLPEGQSDGVYFLIDENADTYWHSKWESGNQPNGTHYFQVEVADLPEQFGFQFTRRKAGSDHITKWGVYGIPTNITNKDCTKDECILLGEIDTPYGAQGETLSSPIIDSRGCKIIRFYAETTTTNRGYWHLAEFRICTTREIDAKEAAQLELQATYDAHENYVAQFTEDKIGTEPGKYPQEKFDAFKDAIDNAMEILESPIIKTMTAEQIKEAEQAIINTYKALLDSKIPLPRYSDGYYFIQSAMEYNETVTGPATIDPETNEEIPGESITTHPIKAMYDNNGNLSWMTLKNDSCPFLFHMSYNEATGNYILKNAAFNRYVSLVKQSTNTTLSDTITGVRREITLTPNGSNDKGYIVAIRRADQTGAYEFLHQGGHGNGANKAGNVVGWSYDPSASSWNLVPVSNEEAQQLIEAFEVIANKDQMIKSTRNMVAESNTAINIAKDTKIVVETDKPAVTQASQYFSPFTTADSQKKEGDVAATPEDTYAFLLEDNEKYWHSAWENGNVAADKHYLQVEVTDLNEFGIELKRRNVNADHITQLRVMGYNENNAELTFEQGQDLGVINFPEPIKKGETVLSKNTAKATGYKYLRFYSENAGGTAGFRGYWHAVKFQLYPATMTTVHAKNQYTEMGKLATDLEAAVAAIPATDEEITPALYSALKSAYDKFMAVYVNPAELRAAIETTQKATEMVVTGDQPGFWSGDVTTALTKAVNDAKAYDESAAYTPEQSKAMIDGMNTAKENMIGAANKIKTGKWYHISFPTEEMYDQYQWAKAGANKKDNEDGSVNSPALYKRVLTVANTITHENKVGDKTYVTYEFEPSTDASEICVGQSLAWVSPDDVTLGDEALFRFVAVGDTAYTIQNKLTGLYLKAAGTSGKVTLSAMPTLFTQKANGYGVNLIEGKRLDGVAQSQLHAQRDGSAVVTWDAKAIGSNSNLMITEVEDVTDVTVDFNINAYNGRFYTFCYPYAVKSTDTNAPIYTAVVNGAEITLYPLEKADAGIPFLFVSPLPEGQEYVKEADDQNGADSYINCPFAFAGTELQKEPINFRSVVGTYYGTNAEKGNLVPEENSFKPVTTATYSIGANQAYLSAKVERDDQGVMPTVTITTSDTDNIQSTLDAVAKSGDIYTLDGKYVGKGNINSVRNLGRGIYIVNGVKVAVK